MPGRLPLPVQDSNPLVGLVRRHRHPPRRWFPIPLVGVETRAERRLLLRPYRSGRRPRWPRLRKVPSHRLVELAVAVAVAASLARLLPPAALARLVHPIMVALEPATAVVSLRPRPRHRPTLPRIQHLEPAPQLLLRLAPALRRVGSANRLLLVAVAVPAASVGVRPLVPAALVVVQTPHLLQRHLEGAAAVPSEPVPPPPVAMMA